MLTKEQILSIQDLKSKTVEVPEWGGSVMVWELTGEERDAFEATLFTGEGKERKLDQRNLRARLCSFAIKDEEGKPVFSMEDVKALGRKNSTALARVFDVAQALSGLDDKSEDKAKKSSKDESSDASISS